MLALEQVQQNSAQPAGGIGATSSGAERPRFRRGRRDAHLATENCPLNVGPGYGALQVASSFRWSELLRSAFVSERGAQCYPPIRDRKVPPYGGIMSTVKRRVLVAAAKFGGVIRCLRENEATLDAKTGEIARFPWRIKGVSHRCSGSQLPLCSTSIVFRIMHIM